VESPNPMLGLSASVTRRKPGTGAAWHPEQRLSREQALRSFTTWAAYAGFDEDVAGMLAPGKYADFIVLDRDIMTCPPDEIAGARVLMTVSGGEIAWTDPAAW
jgi:predicted amidohydrolase YtcJ